MAKERDLNLWSVKLPGKLDVAYSNGESDDELQAARNGDPDYPHVKVYRQERCKDPVHHSCGNISIHINHGDPLSNEIPYVAGLPRIKEGPRDTD